AATRAAAPPVLAPKNPTGRPAVVGSTDSHSVMATRRPARRPMSNRRWPVRRAACSSSGGSGWASRVARPASWRTAATSRLRGLWRLLPLPWAKATTPTGASGPARSASRTHAPAGIWTAALIRGPASDSGGRQHEVGGEPGHEPTEDAPHEHLLVHHLVGHVQELDHHVQDRPGS